MKICLVSGAYPPQRCGVGDHTARLARSLAQQGETVHVLTSQDAGEPPAHPGITVHAVMPGWRLGHLRKLYATIAALRPDVCHLQYPSMGFERNLAPNFLFNLLRWRLPHIQTVITLHEYDIYSAAGRLRLFPALGAAGRIVCTNALDRERVVESWEKTAQKIQIIPLGSHVDWPSRRAGKAKPVFPVPKNQRWVLHFGTVMPNKGWEILLPALKRLRDGNFPVHVLVAGELDPGRYAYHGRVHDMIRRWDLQEFVRFTGYLDPAELAGVFARFPVAVLPFTEGAKLNRSSLVTMLCHHKAVITTDPRIQMEQLRHGRHFWGVLPHDPASLAEGIRHVLSNPELIQRLQSHARAMADYFSWESIGRKYRALYGQLIQAAQPKA